MNAAEAVKLWDELEQMLIRIGLPQDGRLDRLRAELIRKISGDAVRDSAETKKYVREIKLDDSAPVMPRKSVAAAERVTAALIASANTIYNERWAAMIERACSGKSGYSGDDEVTYDQR